MYIALLLLDLFRALEFFPGIDFIALAFYFISQFFLYPYWWYFEFACSIMVCVGVSAEQVLLGSINQSINTLGFVVKTVRLGSTYTVIYQLEIVD